MRSVEAKQPADVSVVTDDAGENFRWGFWRWKTIGDGKTTYVRRLYILVTPFFSIMFHRIFRPDNQRELHDHPWTFLSLILLGHYRENTMEGERLCRWINFKWAEGRHSIRHVSRSPVWTLVFTGPRRRWWGFWVPRSTMCRCEYESHEFGCPAKYDPDGLQFVLAKEYDKLNKA